MSVDVVFAERKGEVMSNKPSTIGRMLSALRPNSADERGRTRSDSLGGMLAEGATNVLQTVTRRLRSAIAWSAALILASSCDATTIVTLISAHGIVMCADGMVNTESFSTSNPGGSRAKSAESSEKLFVIQDRFVIGHAGVRHFDLWKGRGNNKRRISIPYSLDRIIAEVRRESSPMFTLSKISEITRAKLVDEFVGFDVVPQSGILRPEHLPPTTHSLIAEFTIAGYDGETAHVYRIGVDMDWAAVVHRVTPVTTMYPEPEKRKYLSMIGSGHGEAFMELFQRSSPGAREFAAKWPVEYSALGNERDLDVDGMVVLARALLSVQIARTPNDVGYPLRVITILKRGPIRTELYQR